VRSVPVAIFFEPLLRRRRRVVLPFLLLPFGLVVVISSVFG